MKTHLKTHKILPKIGFSRDFKSPNPDFGTRHMDLGVGWWQQVQVITSSTVFMHKTHQTHENPWKPTLKPIKLGQQLGFLAILSHQTPFLGPGIWICVYDDANQSKWLPHPQFVHIKPMKPHLKTHKIGFSRDFKSPNPDFGPRHMDLGVGWWPPVQVVTLSTVGTHKAHKTHENPP